MQTSSDQPQAVPPHSEKKPLVLILGISGSGLSTAVHALEDRGFYVIDNLPLDLISATAKLLGQGDYGDRPGFAFGLHIQSPMSRSQMSYIFDSLKADFYLDVVYLEASLAVLTRRYGASRRPHPLAHKSQSLEHCIELECQYLGEFKCLADIVIDTSDMSPYVLARFFEARYAGRSPSRRLLVAIQSFGFKYGAPQPLEGVFDVRYLSNPYFVGGLSEQNGNDSEVLEFLKADLRFAETIERLIDWHAWVLPQFFDDGRTYYRLGIGCTGGKHRSVAVAEGLFKGLQSLNLEHISLSIQHRDIDLK